MRFNGKSAVPVHCLLAGLLTTGVACSDRLLPAVTSDGGTMGVGGAVMSGGVGGQPAAGVGGQMVMGTGGAPGTGGGIVFTTDPTDAWQVFGTVSQETYHGAKLDLLFMVDNSQSMAPLQTKLLQSFDAFMNALKALPFGLPDIHVAVVSSDTGPGAFDLTPFGCPFLGDQGAFQNKPRGTCTTSPFMDSSSTFLTASNNQQQKNYNGDITDAFKCIALLGDQGCGFEGQLKSVRWALDPNAVPPGNEGFLRPDAFLAVVYVTNEDDCSVPDDSQLLDPTQMSVSDPLGPFWSFRCNEFGHICNNNGVIGPPPRAAIDGLTDCASNENGMLTRVADEIAFLKGLKANPNQVVVSVIAGPPAPYGIEMVSRMLANGTTELQPNIKHSCMESSGEYADPSVRLSQFANGFAGHVFQSICDETFDPVLSSVGASVARTVGPTCVTGPFPDFPPDVCRVVDRNTLSNDQRIDTVVPSCFSLPSGGASPPCWALMPSDGTTCASDSMQLTVYRNGGPLPSAGTAITCAPCPTDHAEIGCP